MDRTGSIPFIHHILSILSNCYALNGYWLTMV